MFPVLKSQFRSNSYFFNVNSSHFWSNSLFQKFQVYSPRIRSSFRDDAPRLDDELTDDSISF